MRRTRGAAAALAGLLLAFLPAAGPAMAQVQAEKLKLVVAGDGATGVTIQAGHPDGRPLEAVVRLVLEAEAANGRKVGPLQLEPAAEGQGFYSSGPVLSPGEWRVTVSAPAPYTGKGTAEVLAKAAQTPPPPAALPERQVSDAPSPWRWWWVGALVALAAAAVYLVARRARRSRDG